MRAKEKVRFGSANIFADLEFENPEEELIRADLAAKVDALLSDLEGNQKEIGQRLGLHQSEVSDLMRGRYGRFSIDRLLRILTKLGCKVDLKVTAPKRPGVLGRMTIRAA
jgi:predicted XRE-type DNA-binding protein